MNPAKTYASELAQNLTKITMTDFFKTIHSRFYADQDISFMEYFLELTEQEGEFVVHHEKLREYGIVTSERSSNIKQKLEQLMLIENEDYVLLDVQQNPSVGGRPSKVYHLTPEAFKKCLMRAQRRANQPVDPVIYCNYYLLLEKIHKLYTDYERLYSEKLLSMKDDKIDEQSRKLDQMSKRLDEQSAEIQQLLGYAKNTDDELKGARNDITELNDNIVELKDEVSTLNDTVLDYHQVHAAQSEHASVEVAPAQRSYFALTVSTRPNDESLYFHTHRVQGKMIMNKMVKLMTKPKLDKSGTMIESVHQLVIPPIYVAGATAIPHAVRAKVKSYCQNIVDSINAKRTKGQPKVKLAEFIKDMDIDLSLLHPVWKPNDYISHGRFVHFFIAVIRSVKFRSFTITPPSNELFDAIQLRSIECQRALTNATGEVRERLERMKKIIEEANSNLIDPDYTSEYESDLTDEELSLYDGLVAVDEKQ